jgi:hypothetical protein
MHSAPAWADSYGITGATAERNSDGTITIRWSSSYQNGNGTIKIGWKYQNTMFYSTLAEVPVSQGYYIDSGTQTMPDQTIVYKLSTNIYDATEIAVPPYIDGGNNEYLPKGNTGNEGNTGGEDNTGGGGEYQPDWSERLAASILAAIPNYFIKIIGLYDPLCLIFQDQFTNNTQKESRFHVPVIAKASNAGNVSVQGDFLSTGTNLVNIARKIAPIIAVLFMMLAGIIFVSGYNDSNKIATAKKILAGLVVCLFLVYAAEKIAGTSLGIIGITPSATVSTDTAIQDNVFLHTFSEAEFGALSEYYDKINEFVPVSLVVVIVLLGMGALYTSATPNAKISFREYAMGLFIGLFALKFGIFLLTVIFDINFAVVKFFQWVAGNHLEGTFISTMADTNTNTLGQVIIAFVATVSVGIINWQYTLRKVIIAILIGLIPVVAIISMYPAKRNSLECWFKEMISQVFIQTAHAIAVSFAVLFIHGADIDFWPKLACISALPSIAILVRKIIGAESGGEGFTGAMGTMLGVGSMLALGRMLSRKNPQIPSKDSGVPDMLTGSGVGSGTSGGLGIGKMLGKAAGPGLRGASVLSMAGAGGIMAGALTGNPAAGIGMGAMLGSSIGGGAAGAIEKVGSLFSMSPDERMQAMGVPDPAMLDSPAEAYAAGKNLFGNGIMGKTAAAGFAGFKAVQGAFGKADPILATQARTGINESQKSLGDARLQMAEYKPTHDKAKADFTYAKNMYGPNSANRASLNKEIESLKKEKGLKEQPYLEALNEYNNKYMPEDVDVYCDKDAAEARAKVINAEIPYRMVERKIRDTEGTIANHDKRFEESKKNYESVEAEYARQQSTVSGFEQKLTTQGIRKEFEKLRQYKINDNPDISWR